MPLPVPDEPDEIVTQDALLAAVQLHPLVALTVTDPVPPLLVNDWPAGEIPNEHGGGAAAWLIVKDCPAIVSVAERAMPVFGETTNETVPLPVPDAPDVIVTQDAPLAAVQLQPFEAVTETDPLPPLSPTD